MRFIILSSVLTMMLSFSVTADDSKKAEMFAKRKAHAVANVDKKISILNSLKSCLSSAQNKDAVKACRKSKKESMKSLKESNKAYREQMKAQRKNRKK